MHFSFLCESFVGIAPKPGKKVVKVIAHTSAYSSLTYFEYEVNEMTGNGNNVNLLTYSAQAWKKRRFEKVMKSKYFFSN